jgi:hypothetical protein
MDAIQAIFSLPHHIKGFSIISLGFPDEKKSIPERYNLTRIHKEKW